jgi:hypothetical protein
MFTSLPSPGRLYELSFSSSAQLDFLTRKCVYILTLRPLHDNGLIIFPIGTPLTTLFWLFSPVARAAVLVDTVLLSFFFQNDYFLFPVTTMNNARLYPHKLLALQPPSFPVSVVSHLPPHLLGQGCDLSPLVFPTLLRVSSSFPFYPLH